MGQHQSVRQPLAGPAHKPRVLIPHEKGAYGQLLLPLACVLALGRPSAAAWLLALSFVLAFLLHEPLVVVLGQRGTRIRREEGPRAWRWLSVMAAAAMASGLGALALGPPMMRVLVLIPAAAAAVIGATVLRKVERSTAGEALVAVGLASCALPLGPASGIELATTGAVAAVFAAGSVAATLAVRGVIRANKGSPQVRWFAVGLGVALGAVSLAAGAVDIVPSGAVAALAPMLVAALITALVKPPATRLRAVGYGLLFASIASSIILLVTLR